MAVLHQRAATNRARARVLSGRSRRRDRGADPGRRPVRLIDRHGGQTAEAHRARGRGPGRARARSSRRKTAASPCSAVTPGRAASSSIQAQVGHDADRGGAGRPDRRRRPAGLRAADRGQARNPSDPRATGAAAAARRAPARLPGRRGQRAQLRGQAGRVHPGDRRPGPPVLGLPRVPRRQARKRPRARPRRHRHENADGPGLPDPGPPREVLRPRLRPAGRGHPRHGRPPRHVRARVPGQVLRGPRLPRPHQLHRQLQPAR